jgi:hypothetical protein
MAPVRLIIRAKTQSEFTQIAYFGGENARGLAKMDGVDPLDMLWFEKSW